MFAHDLFDIKGGEVSLTADTEDLLEMDELHEAPLLQCLENRYNNDVIYVRTSMVCLLLYLSQSRKTPILLTFDHLLDLYWHVGHCF